MTTRRQNYVALALTLALKRHGLGLGLSTAIIELLYSDLL